MNKIVSIIIPTRNSATYLEDSLKSIRKQTYKHIEIIIVDGKSTDNTLQLAKKYKCRIMTYEPEVSSGSFDASFKRNYGAKRAKGNYIFWMDADMQLPPGLIKEAVTLINKGSGSVILPEDSFGTGIWAQAKNLERRCYWGDNTVECPRFFLKAVWDEIGGLDETLGAGGDDLDIHQKVLDKHYVVARTTSIIMHNEGNLKLGKLFKKHFMYGRDTVRYFLKRPKASVISYFPIRPSYIRNIHLFIQRPFDAMIFIAMRSTEYFAGFLGFLYSFIDSYNTGLSKKSTPVMDIEEYADKLPQYYSNTLPKKLEEYLIKSNPITILDCGCGDGSILSALKTHGFFRGKNIHAIDLSQKRIRIVKNIDPQIRARVDNAETLSSIPTSSINFLYSSYVIEHVDNKKMFSAIERVTKKNGIVYLSTIFKKWYGWYYKRKNGKWVMDVTHLHEYTSDEELLGNCNRKKLSVLENKKTQMYFPVVDFILNRLPGVNRNIYLKHPVLNYIRKLTVPIIGYYDWEIVFKRI